jgi:hypothetical protein
MCGNFESLNNLRKSAQFWFLSRTMNNRRPFFAFLTLLALFLVGTVIVLSSISYFFAIDTAAYILERDISDNYTDSGHERVPRIIHQTWKTDSLPPRWRGISQGCRDMMPY